MDYQYENKIQNKPNSANSALTEATGLTMLNIVRDPEVVKDPRVEGERVGKLFWKHTTLLESKPAAEDCAGLMSSLFANLAAHQIEEISDDPKKLLFWKAVSENYKN